jgi:integrase
MPYPEVPAFMRELEANSSLSAKALQLLILTATRTSEVLGATWNGIDLEGATWTMPAERMKGKLEHRVPLPDAAVAILRSLPRLHGNPYLFPGQRAGRPLSNMALLQLMRGQGYGVGGDRGDYVPHGFRSNFRDWAGEVSSFPNHVCEMALAHVIENAAEAAYRRSDLFNRRRAMMQSWADWCGKRGAGVTAIPTAAGWTKG